MTTNSSAFVTNNGALDTWNVLKKAKWEITLVDRTSTNFTASVTEDITTDELYTLWALWQQVPVFVSWVVSSDEVAVLTATANFSVNWGASAAGKTIILSDTEGQLQNVTIAVTAGTVTVTWANGWTVVWNSTNSVAINNVNPWTITYTYVAWYTAWAVTMTVDVEDVIGIKTGAQVSTTITVVNTVAVLTDPDDFSVETLSTTTGKILTVTDAESTNQTVTLAASAGTITITNANEWTVTGNNTNAVSVAWVWTGNIVFSYVAWAAEWAVTLTFNATDWVLAAIQKTTTVTVGDTVLPTLESAERLANTTVRVTLSEDADTATTTKANAGWFVVYETGTPWTTYAVSAIAPNGSNHNQIDLTVADMSASSAAWVTITYVAWWNGTVADVAGNLLATDATWVNAAAWS